MVRQPGSLAAEDEKTTTLIVPEHPVAGLLAGSARAGEGSDQDLAITADTGKLDSEGGAEGSNVIPCGPIETELFEGSLVG